MAYGELHPVSTEPGELCLDGVFPELVIIIMIPPSPILSPVGGRGSTGHSSSLVLLVLLVLLLVINIRSLWIVSLLHSLLLHHAHLLVLQKRDQFTLFFSFYTSRPESPALT